MEAQGEVLENYPLLQQAYRSQVARGDRLERDLNSFFDSASPFCLFVQHRYDLVKHQRDLALRESAEYREVVSKRHDQSAVVDTLRTQLLVETADRQEDHDRFTAQIAAFKGELQKAEQDRAALDTRQDRLKSDHRREIARLQGEIATLSGQLDRKTTELAQTHDAVAELSRRADALQDLNRQTQDLRVANQGLRDQVRGMQLVLTQLTQERDAAYKDRDTLRDLIAGGVSTQHLDPPPLPTPTTGSGVPSRAPNHSPAKRNRSLSPSRLRSPADGISDLPLPVRPPAGERPRLNKAVSKTCSQISRDREIALLSLDRAIQWVAFPLPKTKGSILAVGRSCG